VATVYPDRHAFVLWRQINTHSWSQRAWDAEYAVNVDGTLRLTEQLLPAMKPGEELTNG